MERRYNDERQDFVKKAGLATAAAVGSSTLAAPYVKAQSDQVPDADLCRPSAGRACDQAVDRCLNKAAHGQMEIELYFADQFVPQEKLFRAVQRGAIDACQSDDAS